MQDKIILSVFKNTFDKQPKTATLKTLIEKIKSSSHLKKLCTQFQSIVSKKEQQSFKQKNFPAITVSGIFKNGHNASGLVKHSDLIQIDIDKLDRPGSNSIPKLKKLLHSDPYTFVLCLSVSGLGLKIFVRIDGSKHAESFKALEHYYKERYDLIIDPKCKDIGRLSFLSNDPEIYINEAAQVFATEYLAVEPLKSGVLTQKSNDLARDIEIITKKIEERKIDITNGYENWLNLGFALADALNEQGRSYFHRVSMFYPNYDPKETDKQYSYCLKNPKNGITFKSFFFLAKQHGIDINTKNETDRKVENDIYKEEKSTSAPSVILNEIIFYSPILDKHQNITDVKINYTKFNELLLSFGFQRFDVENDFIMVKLDKNIIEETKATTIQDTFFNHLATLPEILNNEVPKAMLIEKFNKSPETYFSKKRYSLLRPVKEYSFVRDTKDKCYIFYKNGFVECTSQGWQLKGYKDLNGFIWKNQIHDREFIYTDIEEKNINELGDFAKFIFNISYKNDERFSSLCTIIGYNLHTYFEGKLRATVLTDSRISELPDGRTGKSLFTTGLSKIKKACNIKGKDFDPSDKFKYQEADLDDQIVTIDDARKNLDFEMLFNDITEGIKVNKKNLKPFTINAKILITTNRTLKIEGASAKDRSIEFELADYYNEAFSPQDEFKKWFFGNGFSNEDWMLFDNFMMHCIFLYLQIGVKKASTINLNRRKLIESTNTEFVEFMDSKVSTGDIQPGNEYLKQELHNQFLTEYPEYKDDKYLSKLKYFTLYLRLYAKYTEGFVEVGKEDERKSNDKRYIRFR